LLDGSIDLAVHSMKDVPTLLPAGLTIGCIRPRADVRDAFISLSAPSLAALPPGAVVGTASLRRQAQVRRLRPDLEVKLFRGNVETRLRKLADGEADATLLALAGLQRLGLADRVTAIMEPDMMLPAVAQGAIGVEIRADDQRVRALLAPLHHQPTAVCIAAERALLAGLDGSCRTPIAGLATLEAGSLHLRGMILTPDGSCCHETERKGPASEAQAMGADAAAELLGRVGPDFLKDGAALTPPPARPR
jgi:hydroxymethylbilane synthase